MWHCDVFKTKDLATFLTVEMDMLVIDGVAVRTMTQFRFQLAAAILDDMNYLLLRK